MLDSTRDSYGKVDLGSDDLSSLADLHFVGAIACINGCSGSSYSTVSKDISQLIKDFEVVFVL